MPRDPREAAARSHLSSDILRTVDRSGIRYDDMVLGQSIAVHAHDAVTKQPGSFLLRVVSIRQPNSSSKKDATFEYIEGDFAFYVQRASGVNTTTRIKPGALMESGVTARFVPQTDYRMVYVGGIGVGRDHSFEYIEGEDSFVVAHDITMLEVGDPAADFKAPDISDHLGKVEKVQNRRREDEVVREDMVRRVVMEDIEQHFGKFPYAQAIKDLISGYSPNGQLVMSSFLIYGEEDGVLDRAWEVLQKADSKHFSYEHPAIRGDLDIKASSREVYEQMIEEAGIQWPRPEEKITEIVVPEDPDRTARLTRKAGEYKQRGEDSDSLHKRAVLEEVLATGTVLVEELKERLKEKSWFNDRDFDRAVRVISDYCKTGGENLGGGTGLH